MARHEGRSRCRHLRHRGSAPGQRIHVGIVHAGRTLTVEAADSTRRIYDGEDGLIAEVARTTTKPVTRRAAGPG